MALSIWEVFLNLVREGKKPEESDNKDDESRFIPSPLDLSVRIGHGGTDGQRMRELSKIHEQARTIEEKQLNK